MPHINSAFYKIQKLRRMFMPTQANNIANCHTTTTAEYINCRTDGTASSGLGPFLVRNLNYCYRTLIPILWVRWVNLSKSSEFLLTRTLYPNSWFPLIAGSEAFNQTKQSNQTVIKMVEAPMHTGRRKIVQHTISLFAQESGFQTADKNALDLLTEMFQAILHEMGRSTRTFTELAGRVEPTVGDFTMALIDMGLKVDPVGLRVFSKRHARPLIPQPQNLPLPKVPMTLSTGKKRSLPSYIPDYFPQMPDSHAYIRTPTHKQPITDYAVCREKTSQQKRDLERSLSKFFARTSECYYLFPENKLLFPLISPKPVTYLDPLVPRDQLFEEDDGSEPLNHEKKEKPVETVVKQSDNSEDGSSQETIAVKTTTSWELIDNPFLKSVIPRPKKQSTIQKK